MNLFKKSMSLLLVAVMSVGLAACDGEPVPSTDTGSHRPDYVEDSAEKPLKDVNWEDTDGQFEYKEVDWAGPAGYVIVVPAGDSNARETAEILQEYYSSLANVTLQIVTDATQEKDKEILIGKTKRSQSAKDINEGDLKVSVKGNKLVFDGGHYVSVKSAVEKFVRLAPKAGKAYTFEVSTDFSSTIFLDGYEYVWGDEFEGEELDLSKWSFYPKMVGSTRCMISYDRDVIDTADGRLKLHGIRYFDPSREGTAFKMPYSTTTLNNMNFRYGYAEIRARLPYHRGAWPSFWTNSDDTVSSKYGVYRKSNDIFVEVDVFEVFGSPDRAYSNIHKFYTKYKCQHPDCTLGKHPYSSSWSAKKEIYIAPDKAKINQEYHVYGWQWTPKIMSFYVDDELIMTYDITNSYDNCPDMSGFQDPEYVMFNSHLLSIDWSHSSYGYIDEYLELLPSEYYIDYFRLYQKKGEGGLWIDDTENVYVDRK